MADRATCFTVGDLTGVIPAPALSPAERRELHQRVPGLHFEAGSAQSVCNTEIQVGQSTVARPAPGSPRVLRRAINAALTFEALRHETVMVHGAVVGRGAEALLILGDYNAGKTRLALAMAELGFDGLAGDLALITAKGAVSGGTRAVLSKWPLDAAGKALPPTDLGLPEGATRWHAAECLGGPYPDCTITRIVQLVPTGAQVTPPAADPKEALSAAVQRARSRAIDDADWHAMLQRRPEIAATQARVVQALAARLPVNVITADFPACIDQSLGHCQVVCR